MKEKENLDQSMEKTLNALSKMLENAKAERCFRTSINGGHLKDVWNFIKDKVDENNKVTNRIYGDEETNDVGPFLFPIIKKALTKKQGKDKAIFLAHAFREDFLGKYPELKIKTKFQLAKVRKDKLVRIGMFSCTLCNLEIPECITDFDNYEDFKHYTKDIKKESVNIYLEELQECLQVIRDFDELCDWLLFAMDFEFTAFLLGMGFLTSDDYIEQCKNEDPFPEVFNAEVDCSNVTEKQVFKNVVDK